MENHREYDAIEVDLLEIISVLFSRFWIILGSGLLAAVVGFVIMIAFARNVLIWYGVSVVAYGVVTYIICTYRYSRVRRSLKRYYQNLKKLNSLYRE